MSKFAPRHKFQNGDSIVAGDLNSVFTDIQTAVNTGTGNTIDGTNLHAQAGLDADKLGRAFAPLRLSFMVDAPVDVDEIGGSTDFGTVGAMAVGDTRYVFESLVLPVRIGIRTVNVCCMRPRPFATSWVVALAVKRWATPEWVHAGADYALTITGNGGAAQDFFSSVGFEFVPPQQFFAGDQLGLIFTTVQAGWRPRNLIYTIDAFAYHTD